MNQRMIDIVVNDQLVAIVIEDLAKLFVTTLVNELPLEVSIATYVHYEEPAQESAQNLEEYNVSEESVE